LMENNWKYIFFKVRFNNFRDVSGSTVSDVTDKEIWDECECVLCLPESYSDESMEICRQKIFEYVYMQYRVA